MLLFDIVADDALSKPLNADLLHAIIHLIMKHGERGLGKNKEIWGISCDVNAHKMVIENQSIFNNYRLHMYQW